LCFGMFAKQARVNQRCEIAAALCGQLKALMNEVGQPVAPRGPE
jgi:hypothetical protein